jgi:ribosomal protein S18 acetylase RimI-like enzyme
VEDSPAVAESGEPKRWVVVRPPGAQTGLLLARADGERQAAVVGEQHAGRVGFFLRVDDFDAVQAKLVAAGVEFVRPARAEPYGKVAVFLDVAGNRWDLLGPRPAEPTVPYLRPATAADAEAIASLWHRGWPDGHLGNVPEELVRLRTPEDFRRRVPSRLPFTTVALLGERLAGFVMTHGDEIEQVYVAAEARGHGVADALMGHAEREIAARGHGVAWLAVVAGNTRARRFYERCGWRDAGGFDYAADVEGGTLPVPCRRYEKEVSG